MQLDQRGDARGAACRGRGGRSRVHLAKGTIMNENLPAAPFGGSDLTAAGFLARYREPTGPDPGPVDRWTGRPDVGRVPTRPPGWTR